MSEFHEPPEKLSDEVKDFHRALISLQEEIEAVDIHLYITESFTFRVTGPEAVVVLH